MPSKLDSNSSSTSSTASFSALTQLGFELADANGDQFDFHRPALSIRFWPHAERWMSFGQVRDGDIDDVCRFVNKGRLAMPDWARPGQCRYCGAKIWWLTTNKGRRMPLEWDGACHIDRCSEQS